MRRRACAVSLVASATLLAELVITRALSAGLYHHLAYFVVSTALLATGVAGVGVHLRRVRNPHGRSWASPAALLFAVGLPLCFALSQVVKPEPLLAAVSAPEAARLVLVFLVLGFPFFGGGWVVAEILDGSDRNAPTLYAADLLGAAVGSVASLGCVAALSGQDALFVASLLASISALVLSDHPTARRVSGLVLGATVIPLFLSVLGFEVLPLHVSALKRTADGDSYAAILADPSRTLRTAWTSSGRVDRVRFANGTERLVIDGGAAAVRIPGPRHPVHRSDATLPYELIDRARVLIIGSGAGWEIEEALAFGASTVEAVEVNPAIAAETPDSLRNHPRVALHVDEARSFAARAAGPFDVVIMIHTISNAATAAGALHLAENFLLTREAVARWVTLLSDRGVLFITRPEAHLPRLTATLRAVIGPTVPRRAFLWAERAAAESFYAAALVTKMELPAADRKRIVDRIRETPGLRLIAAPGHRPSDPLYAGLLDGEDPRHLEALAGRRLDPALDDRPYFNQRRRFSQLSGTRLPPFGPASHRARLALEEEPIAEWSTLLLLLLVILVAAAALMVPFAFGPRARVRPPGTGPALLYFSLVGIGFMLVEVALVQRLTLLLGRPALGFTVVFGGLLAGASLGSRFVRVVAPNRYGCLLASAAALGLCFALPAVVDTFVARALPLRVVVALAVVVTVGFCLGAPFPRGLQEVSDRPGLGALGLAANAFFSVAATALAVVLATEIGFTGVFGLAGLVYGGAIGAFPARPS